MAMARVTGSSEKSGDAQNVVFFHPDLGIGGAERLIIDAAVGLQQLGHKITIFTSHCDPSHCFDEARDGTLDVRVRGNSIFPPTVLRRFHILFATLRQLHLVLAITLFSNELRALKPTIFVVDQLSACVPLLYWIWPDRQRILFYCHFPDQLLARREEKRVLGLLKQLYRYPFDWYEGWSMSASDRIVVNSSFTKTVVNELFRGLGDLEVIYPCVNIKEVDEILDSSPPWPGKNVLLSVNRFERKKNIALALRAFAKLPASVRRTTRLVVAGGYDSRVAENVDYHKSLESLATSLGLSHATARSMPTALAISNDIQVLFLLSVPNAFKDMLLRSAKLLVYTPTNEHFGIVPVEAMLNKTPVLASNTGGPLETIVDGQTGWLRDVDNVEAWTRVMAEVVNGSDASQQKLKRMGDQGRRRVKQHFSRTVMAERLQKTMLEMQHEPRKQFIEWRDILLVVGVCGALTAIIVTSVTRFASYTKISTFGERI